MTSSSITTSSCGKGRSPPAGCWLSGYARLATWTEPSSSTTTWVAGPCGCRPAQPLASAKPCGPRIRWASPWSSFTTRRWLTGYSSVMTCDGAPRWRGWTTSTSWSPTCRRPTSTTRRWASACPKRSRIARRCMRPGCTASRPCTTWPSPGEPGRAFITWGSSHTRRITFSGSATSSGHCTRRGISSADPADTGCPTRSTCTCATRTAIGWRSTPATTTPGTPIIRSCAGTSPTRAAATSMVTPSSPRGTPRRPRCWISTGTRGRLERSGRSRRRRSVRTVSRPDYRLSRRRAALPEVTDFRCKARLNRP